MPGTITAVEVKAGDAVKTGQVLVQLEAMKMVNAIKSPRDGVVADGPRRSRARASATVTRCVTFEEA